jgi:aminopeptidase-like protein
MGCDKYRLNENIIAFSELNDDVGCLCTFANDSSYTLAPETVRSLAYLGATVVLLHQKEIDHGFMPSCLPDWIKKDIDRIVLNK